MFSFPGTYDAVVDAGLRDAGVAGPNAEVHLDGIAGAGVERRGSGNMIEACQRSGAIASPGFDVKEGGVAFVRKVGMVLSRSDIVDLREGTADDAECGEIVGAGEAVGFVGGKVCEGGLVGDGLGCGE